MLPPPEPSHCPLSTFQSNICKVKISQLLVSTTPLLGSLAALPCSLCASERSLVWFLALLLCKIGSLLPCCWHGVFFVSSFLQFKILCLDIVVLYYIFVYSPFIHFVFPGASGPTYYVLPVINLGKFSHITILTLLFSAPSFLIAPCVCVCSRVCVWVLMESRS